MLLLALWGCAPTADVDTDTVADDCDTVIAITIDPAGERCADLEERATCCPDGWAYLGFDARQQTVCWTDACLGVAVIEGACPDGWTSMGTDSNAASACVEVAP